MAGEPQPYVLLISLLNHLFQWHINKLEQKRDRLNKNLSDIAALEVMTAPTLIGVQLGLPLDRCR